MHLDSSNKKNLANAGIENQQLPNLKTSATRMLKRNASVKENPAKNCLEQPTKMTKPS
jgi:hypothetical protein